MLTPLYQFLQQLEKNNNKAWFENNRKLYQNNKALFLSIVEAVLTQLTAIEPTFSALQPKDCTFRINRDVRFSKNKNPYKTNMAAYFSKGGKKSIVAGYYFHIEPGKSFIAGGFYGPPAAELTKIRQEIDYNFEEWKKILKQANFKKHFPTGMDESDKLVRPPKGYDDSNPAIDVLKLKSYIVSRPIADEMLKEGKLVHEIMVTFKAMKPLVDFLNQAVE
jgi:uncharacterized protein (TIGR02453 family)